MRYLNKLPALRFAYLAAAALLWTACSNSLATGTAPSMAAAATPIDGEKIFKAKCAQCHKCGTDAAAPALNGTMKNWPDKKTFYAFVRNSQEVIKTNAYAKELFKKWMNTVMPAFPGLSNKEIDAVMNWCSSKGSPAAQ